MADLALHKHVLEFCNHPEQITADHDDLDYDAQKGGYLGIHHPAFVTIDLERTEEIEQISIKLFDFEDEKNKTQVPKGQEKNYRQQYAFRLLCSEDLNSWSVLYDTTKAQEEYGDLGPNTCKPYRKGWQWAILDPHIKMRYFRIHALHNPANSGFHIVRVRLFNEKNEKLQIGDKMSIPPKLEIETGDAIPLSVKLLNLTQRLDVTVPTSLKKEKEYSELTNYIVERSIEFDSVDGKVDQFRRIITPHIANILEQNYRGERSANFESWSLTMVIIIIKIVLDYINIDNKNIVLTLFSLVLVFISIYVSRKWIASAWNFVKGIFSKSYAEYNENDSNVLSQNVSCIQSDNNNVPCSVFCGDVREYNMREGFHVIPNPGWLEIHLIKPAEISYIRFLLWDNCGSEKKQPSHRKYIYRMLISSSTDVENMIWETIYDNHRNPSNGWQEFYFEDGSRLITAIKLQFFYTLSLSYNPATHIVSIQAYKNPTKNICKWNSIKPHTQYAPSINKGMIRNRVIIGSTQKQMDFIVESEITQKIQSYLEKIENNCIMNSAEIRDIDLFKDEIRSNTKDDLCTQMDLFYKSIMNPINERRNKIQENTIWMSLVSNIILAADLFPTDLCPTYSTRILYIKFSIILIVVSIITMIGLFMDKKRNIGEYE